MGSGRNRAVAALGVSLAMHLACLWLLVLWPPLAQPSRPFEENVSVTVVEFDVDSTPPASAYSRAGPVETRDLPPPTVERPADTRHRRPHRGVRPAPKTEPVGKVPLAAEPALEEGAPTEIPEIPDAVGTIDPGAISPESAALTMVDVIGTTCEPPQHHGVFVAGRRDVLTLDESLSSATGLPFLRPRDPPRLRRTLDGSYRYEGHVFDAVIEPDGIARFEERSGVTPLLPIGKFGFDLTDFVEGVILKKELYTAEKRWFLEETGEFREKLARRHREEYRVGMLTRLRGKLIIVTEDRRLNVTDKHRLILELWDECAGDEIGEQAREAIAAFVRENMPPGSPLAFSREELRRFNAARAGRSPFNPYN